ncbi:hypothetical protein, partial [Shigella flexneri]|uniref:hypothetical protein n=1 Tax=Shigella flexneri TaxID=623 RepID=UPI00374D8B11
RMEDILPSILNTYPFQAQENLTPSVASNTKMQLALTETMPKPNRPTTNPIPMIKSVYGDHSLTI